MTDQTLTNAYFYSSLATDPDLAEIVEMFVAEMPERVDALKSQYENQNWGELQRLAHQLKGAAGSYGFDQLTPYSAQLEDALQNNADQSEILQAYSVLVDNCGRVQSGSAE